MREHATQFAQFVGVGLGPRRCPGHITIGTHQHSRGGHLTDRPPGGVGEPVVFVGQRSRHVATVGEINKQRPSAARELRDATCSARVGDGEVGYPAPGQWMRIGAQGVAVFSPR